MAVYRTHSDLHLTELLKASDHVAFTEIYNRYHYLLIAFAYRKLRDEDLAEDYVQDLFATLWENRNKLTDSGDIRAYLYVVLRSKILNYFKHQGVQTKYTDALKHAFSTSTNAQTDFLVREKYLNEYIEKQISSLPKKMRVTFQMSRNEQLSHKEIARKLNTSEENVSMHITRALKALRTKLTSWMLIF